MSHTVIVYYKVKRLDLNRTKKALKLSFLFTLQTQKLQLFIYNTPNMSEHQNLC